MFKNKVKIKKRDRSFYRDSEKSAWRNKLLTIYNPDHTPGKYIYQQGGSFFSWLIPDALPEVDVKNPRGRHDEGIKHLLTR